MIGGSCAVQLLILGTYQRGIPLDLTHIDIAVSDYVSWSKMVERKSSGNKIVAFN